MKRKMTLLITIPILFSKAITAQTYSLDWNTAFTGTGGNWIAGDTTGTASNVDRSGNTITVRFVNSQASSYVSSSPVTGSGSNYTLPGPTGSHPMALYADWTDLNQNITATITFSTPVANPSFYVGDIDKVSSSSTATTSYFDQVTVTRSTPSGTTINATATKFNSESDVVVISGNVAAANPVVGEGDNVPTNSPTGTAQDDTVLFKIAGTVSSITLVYNNSTAGTVSSNPYDQAIVIGDISFVKTVPVKGLVFNDVNGNQVKDPDETNIRPVPLYANIYTSGKVIGTDEVGGGGNYSVLNMASNINIIIRLSNTEGIIGAAAPAIASIPNYKNTTPLTITAVNTGTAGLTQQNFGIQRIPESAVNVQTMPINSGVGTTILPEWFVNSTNSATNPSTQDYDGGTVTSIRITDFPSNASSITINDIKYIASSWPTDGITIPYTSGTGPTQPIIIEPVNGTVNVRIPFVAIDNAGEEDPTPESVTVRYVTTLPIKQENFTAAKQGEAVILSWMVGDEADVAGYEVEFSINAINFASINYVSALNMGKYNFLHTTPVTGLNFYRLKIRDRDGNYTYSNIAKVNFTKRNAILLYPNPAKDALNMTMANNMVNKPALINIFSMDGKLILTRSIKALSRTELLDIGKIATGKYIVQTIVDGDIINNSIEVIR